jgi:hypothetical protein
MAPKKKSTKIIRVGDHFLPLFYVYNHMANIISLAGEARDFKQAEYISTGQIYPTNPPEAMQASAALPAGLQKSIPKIS